MARKAVKIGEVWNQYVAMVTNLLSLYCGVHLVDGLTTKNQLILTQIG